MILSEFNSLSRIPKQKIRLISYHKFVNFQYPFSANILRAKNAPTASVQLHRPLSLRFSSTTKSPPLKKNTDEIHIPFIYKNYFKEIGIDSLISWKEMFNIKKILRDIFAGLHVALITAPLSLSVAIMHGAPPEMGLITAIISGGVAALFQGTKLGITGPIAAGSVLVTPIIYQYGFGVLSTVIFSVGILQILSGCLGLGSMIKLIPKSVVSGFFFGIGTILLTGQMPHMLGINQPLLAGSSPLENLQNVLSNFSEIQGPSLLLAIITLTCIYNMPKKYRDFPGALLGVTVSGVFNYFANLSAPTLGPISLDSMTFLHLPSLPTEHFGTFFSSIFVLYAFLSLNSLNSLNSFRTQKEFPHKEMRGNPNLEFIGQGISNTISSLLGGLPAALLAARTNINVKSGAQTRRAALIHAGLLFGMFYYFAPFISLAPIPSLSAALFGFGFHFLHTRDFMHLNNINVLETIPFAVTFLTMFTCDIILAIELGFLSAFSLVFLQGYWKLGRYRHTLVSNHGNEKDSLKDVHNKLFWRNVHNFVFSGSMSFICSLRIARFCEEVKVIENDFGTKITLDFTELEYVDSGVAEMLALILEDLINTKNFHEFNLEILNGRHEAIEPIILSTSNITLINILKRSIKQYITYSDAIRREREEELIEMITPPPSKEYIIDEIYIPQKYTVEEENTSSTQDNSNEDSSDNNNNNNNNNNNDNDQKNDNSPPDDDNNYNSTNYKDQNKN